MKCDELKEAMKESPRRYTNPFLSDEENEKVNFWNNQELERSNVEDGLTNNCEDEKFRSLGPCNLPSDFFEKETEFYTDKNVMECDLPELLVCYKESAFQVKDICVDDGIPHGERILFDENNHEIRCISSPTNEGKQDDIIEDSLHTQYLKPQGLRFSSMEDYYMEPDLCSGTNRKVDTDLPVLEPTNDHMDIGGNRDEVIERNLDIQLVKGERIRSSSREDSCMKSDASSGTQEADTNLPVTGPTNDHIDTEIPVQCLHNSVPDKDFKDCEDDTVKECGTKEEAIDSIVPNEFKNMSKDDNGDDDGPSECSHDKLKVSAESDTVLKATDNYGPEISIQTGEKQFNSSANLLDDASTEQVVSNSVPSLQQDGPLPSLQSHLESINGTRDFGQQPCQSPVEAVSEKSVAGNEAEELGRSIQTTNISNESVTEGSNVLNLNNGKPATSSGLHGVQNPENVDELSIEAQGEPKHLDVASDNVAMVNPVQRGEGESSFSVAGPVSGRITYSGPIVFSGSISIRSDSSTTSTRSFAFPILQTEWNSSPVRMAKADRRRLQKHRGWRHGLLCCRF
ncbi:hypothetical protein L6452_13534 [Arctium lappa]|uniref:Uncharacterized protein n=1 Tax=Arctium lappa TaxID=4217 RepID=A0ACB9CIT5_ARCLA|nr:hypothetical protein L6452_13534 [Arctium lappa]